MDVKMDYIDNNYVWQRRVHRVLRSKKTPVPFPYAAEIGVEFNPAFEREEKIDVNLLTNGAILDLHDFAKSVTKSECLNLFDILEFNFDLGLSLDSPQRYTVACRVHSSAKTFKDQFKARPVQFHSKLNDVFPLPDTFVDNPDLLTNPRRYSPSESPFGMDGSGQISDDQQTNSERIGRPIFIKKSYGHTIKLSMDNYPICKKLGVNFVLWPANAPAQKLSTTLLTFGAVLEMLDFARFLCGTYLQMLKDLILHNFGEVYDSCYLSTQIKSLTEKKLYLQTAEQREAFRRETFHFMIRKRKFEKKKGPDLESDVEVLPVKRRATMSHLNSDYVWQDTETSYMCPVEFDSDMLTNLETENVKSEEGLVDVETVFPESVSIRQKLKEECVPVMLPQTDRFGRPKKTPTRSISEIFSEDIYLQTSQKTLKQKEWTRRSDRIKEILNKSGKVSDIFYRCREISLDFNVGSGRKQNLDKTCLTNHTLYEVNRFSMSLFRSLSCFLSNIMENNFNLTFQDEVHERNFLFYLITKEKLVYNQAHNETFLNSTIPFPEGYNMVDVTGDFKSEEEQNSNLSADNVTDSANSEFPYCEKIGLNLWSLEGRSPDRKLDLTVLTFGALFEIISFGRRLCSKPRDLVHDILEHNFDVDLEDSSSEDFNGINKWFSVQKQMIRKVFSTIRGNAWLTEVVNLKRYSTTTSRRQYLKDTVASTPVQKNPECTYDICKQIGLDLTVCYKSETKEKLDLQSLTRGALFEVHHFVKTKCNRYVPALYEILEYNFDLSSQKHRKVEFAWSIAAQVLAMVRKSGRKGDYMNQVFELPFELPEIGCKEEPEDSVAEADLCDDDDVLFVQKLIPVDIDVEIE